MSDHFETVWSFKTARFHVELSAELERDADLSWDDTGEVAEKIESGALTNYCFRVRVVCDGNTISETYLGNSIYADAQEFQREHIGLRAKSREDGCSYGDYFTDMVHEVIADARKYLAALPRLRAA